MSSSPGPRDDSISVPINLDADGFLRRECPRCERQFKWYPSDRAEPVPPEGYHCPYCDHCAGPDAWFTKEQLTYIEQVGANVFGGRLMDELEAAADRSDFLTVERAQAPEPVMPDEPNDMRRVELECHLAEPLKVDASWDGPVHCLLCGTCL